MKSKRQKHSGAFKAKVVIEALQEQESFSELSVKYGILPNMSSRWKKEFPDRAPGELFYKQVQIMRSPLGELSLSTFHF